MGYGKCPQLPSIWGDKIHELNFAGNNVLDHMYGVTLDDVPVPAWSGLIPQQVVAAISSLIAISPGVVTAKTKETARRIAAKINAHTNDAVMALWTLRHETREARQEPSSRRTSRVQTCQTQAKLLAQQGMLPGRAGEGQMTYEDFLTLPKPHQINKIKKVLRDMNGLKPKDVVHYLPPVGSLLRSHTRLENDECVTQTGRITRNTGDTSAPVTGVATIWVLQHPFSSTPLQHA